MKNTFIVIGILMTAVAVFLWYFAGNPSLGKLSEVLPGTYQREIQRMESPDHLSLAVFWHKEKHGMALPPEPAKTLARWSRLKISRSGKSIYDSSDENLNIYQNSFGLDAIWSPDSKHLAYRHINRLRTMDASGKATTHNSLPADSIISSFRWIDSDNLILVSKRLESPPSRYGTAYDCYPSYCENAVDIRITRLSLTTGKEDLHTQPLGSTTFLFHALDFQLEEISPSATRVAFSDGSHLCIFDTASKKIIARVVIPQKPTVTPIKTADYPPEIPESIQYMPDLRQKLEGLWWQSDNQVVVGMGLLGSDSKSFYTYDITSNQLADVTNILLPIWNGSDDAKNYRNPNWFGTAIR